MGPLGHKDISSHSRTPSFSATVTFPDPVAATVTSASAAGTAALAVALSSDARWRVLTSEGSHASMWWALSLWPGCDAWSKRISKGSTLFLPFGANLCIYLPLCARCLYVPFDYSQPLHTFHWSHCQLSTVAHSLKQPPTIALFSSLQLANLEYMTSSELPFLPHSIRPYSALYPTDDPPLAHNRLSLSIQPSISRFLF